MDQKNNSDRHDTGKYNFKCTVIQEVPENMRHTEYLLRVCALMNKLGLVERI